MIDSTVSRIIFNELFRHWAVSAYHQHYIVSYCFLHWPYCNLLMDTAMLLCLLFLLIGGHCASGQLAASGSFNRSFVVVQPSSVCTCQPCGCEPNGSCAGSIGCAPVPPPGGYFGGASAPSLRNYNQPRFSRKIVLITGGTCVDCGL